MLKEIENHWKTAAKNITDADGLRPTARDPYLQSVVETAIERYLYPKSTLLDIGCGDGLSTIRFAKTTGSALGVDYIEGFVRTAKNNAETAGVSNISFAQADVLNLGPIREKFGLFDIAVSIRCLINLPDWSHQSLALRQIAHTVRPGGLYITSEGWEEGLDDLNIYRHRVQLPEISVAKYNCFIKRLTFEEEAKNYFEILTYVNLGLYLFLSRVVQPMFTAPEKASHTHRLNKVAADIVNVNIGDSSFQSCDYCGVYVLRRLAN